MSAPISDDLAIPDGLPDWVATFLRRLAAAPDIWLNQELDTTQAAREAGRSTETIRRAVRGGRLPDHRKNPKAHMAIRRRDLQQLAPPGDGSYDPTADAQDIARLRRKA